MSVYRRWFWLSWDEGRLQFGTGVTVGTGRVFSYEDANMFEVNSIAYGLGAQYQWGHDIAWRVPMTAIGEYPVPVGSRHRVESTHDRHR